MAKKKSSRRTPRKKASRSRRSQSQTVDMGPVVYRRAYHRDVMKALLAGGSLHLCPEGYHPHDHPEAMVTYGTDGWLSMAREAIDQDHIWEGSAEKTALRFIRCHYKRNYDQHDPVFYLVDTVYTMRVRAWAREHPCD